MSRLYRLQEVVHERPDVQMLDGTTIELRALSELAPVQKVHVGRLATRYDETNAAYRRLFSEDSDVEDEGEIMARHDALDSIINNVLDFATFSEDDYTALAEQPLDEHQRLAAHFFGIATTASRTGTQDSPAG